MIFLFQNTNSSYFILTYGLQIGVGDYFNETESETPPESGWKKYFKSHGFAVATQMRIEYVKAAPMGWTKIWDNQTNALRYHHTRRNETVDTISEANTLDARVQTVILLTFQ